MYISKSLIKFIGIGLTCLAALLGIYLYDRNEKNPLVDTIAIILFLAGTFMVWSTFDE